MTAVLQLEQAARLRRAEAQWLAACAARLQRASGSTRPVEPGATGHQNGSER